jgi:protein TonB
LSQVAPRYPESARQQGIQGTVMLKIQILSNGRPGFVSVYRSSGNGSLDDAAVEAVQQWRFIPSEDRNTGEAITCVTTMPVAFRLN